MKIIFYVIFFFLVSVSQHLLAQQWVFLGDSVVSDKYGDYPGITLDNNDVPYVAFRNGMYATVKKFENGTWNTVGPKNFSQGDPHDIQIKFDTHNVPYICYTDYVAIGNTSSGKPTVMKFDGVNWNSVGASRFTPGNVSFTSMALDTSGTPYVAFRDFTFAPYAKASVMKFDGTNWNYLGSPGFSGSSAGYTSIVVDKYGTVYVGYMDMLNTQFHASVMKFQNGAWSYVGTPRFTSGSVGRTKLALDSSGTLYIAFIDGGNGYKGTVMKFDGTNWIPVGNPGFTTGSINFPSLSITKNNEFYFGFSDDSHTQKASVLKFDGVNWVNIGNPGFTPSEVLYTSIAVDNSNNVYMAFKNGAPHYDTASSFPYYPASVMKFQSVAGIIESKNTVSVNLFPNPTSGRIRAVVNSNTKAECKWFVYAENGQKIISGIKKVSGNFEIDIDLTTQSAGIYFIEIVCGEERRTRKIILEK